METTGIVLIATAASLGFVHTIAGPDHYLPFIFLSRAKGWSLVRSLAFTALCGFGHVLSSVILGIVGIAAGLAISEIELFDGYRGNVVSISFLIFGFIYLAISLWKLYNKKEHQHDLTQRTTPWIIFIIFFLGPCEPLIPLLMYPAAEANWMLLASVTFVFSAITILTMLLLVFVGLQGYQFLPSRFLARYSHVLAGLVIFLCGVGMVFFDL